MTRGAPPLTTLTVRTGLPDEAADATLIERVEVAGAGAALWLTRAQTRRRALEREWLRRSGAGFRGLFATLPEWVRERYDRLPGRLPLVSDPEQLRLLQRLLADEAGGRADHPFRQAERRHGLVDRFRQLVANLKQEGARTERDASRLIRRMEGVRGGQAPFLHDPVTRVFGAYVAALARLGLADDEDTFFRVADELAAHELAAEGAAIAAPRLLVVEGCYHLNAVQRGVLEALARRADETVVLMDGVFEGGVASAGVDAVWRDEISFWKELGARFEPRVRVGGGADPARAALVRFGRREAIPPAAAPAACPLTIARHARPLDELRGIARAIRDLRARPGGAAARIAVMFPSLESVAALADEVFLRYEIPFRVVDRIRVASTAPARALRDLIDALAGGFTRLGVMALVLSPLVEIAGLGTREDVQRLDLALRHARFHGGRGAAHWQRRIERRLVRLAAEEETLLDIVADASGAAADCVAAIETADLARDVASIAATRDALATIVRGGERLASDLWPEEGRNPDAAARDWLALHEERRLLEGPGARLCELLARWEPLRALRNPLDLAEALIEAYKSLNLSAGLARCAERSLGAAAGEHGEDAPLSERLVQRDLRAWRQTAQAVGEVGRLLALEGGEHAFDVFTRQVQEVLAVEEIDLAEADDPREVVVLSRLDARQMRFDHVFLGGLTAEAVPGRQKVNIFFGEEERRLVGWRTHDDTIDEWRHVLAMLAAGSGALHLGWSGSAVEAPSLLAQELCEAFGVDWRAAQATAATVGDEPAWSAREVALRFARGATSQIAGREGERTRRQRTVRVRVAADAMQRRVDVANERAAPPALSRHDGLLDVADPALGEAQRLAGRFGITALERYAACGWEAWARNVVALAPLPELGDTPERHEQGSIVHRALAELAEATARAAGGWPEAGAFRVPELAHRATLFHDALPDARAHADDILHAEAEEFADADAFWRGRVARLALGLREAFDAAGAPPPPRSIDRVRGPLDNLTHFLATRLDDFAPLAVEAAIGVERARGMVLSREPVALPIPEEEARRERTPFSSAMLSVRGIVDRVDLVGVDGRAYVVVFDYKTGRGGDQREINEGLRFQLPLYLAAAVAALRARGAEVEPGGGVYLGIGDAEIRLNGFATTGLSARLRDASVKEPERRYEARTRIHPVAAMEEFLGACIANAARARDAALRGRFPTSWIDARRCGECDFHRICRHDEETKRGWWRAHRLELAALGLYAPHDLSDLAPPPPRR